jgi:ribonuclease HI
LKSSPRLYLLDGSSYIYRAYYGIRELATSGGMPTNAILGFTRLLLDLLQEHRPDYLAVVLDCPREETFRRALYPAYKAQRDAVPVDLVPQLPYIRQILAALNIPALEAPGFEADDVIATLARTYAAQGIDVTIVSGDKDLLQIASDQITLLDTMKGKRSGVQEVRDRFGVSPELVADVLGLAGDTSDNIPGVPGIGEKTAIGLVQRFGSLEEVLKWRSLVGSKKRREALATYAEQARLSKRLATVRYDVPLEIPLIELTRQSPHLPALLPLLRELEFTALELAFTPPPAGVVEIYSDGSGRDSGPGGYGVILRYGELEKELSGFEPSATSQRMELIAAIRGLEALNGRKRVRLYSDSQYLVRGMSEWLPGWVRNGRLETPDALANQDLWQQLATLGSKHQVHWEWVRGHAGHPFNERCDKLAKRAAEAGILATVAITREEVVPLPAAPVYHAPVAIRVDSEFATDADGQLQLC